MRFAKAVENVLLVGLGTHAALTPFQNSPDTKINFNSMSALVAGLPQWRFFAPNPGIDDTHLMMRTQVDDRWGAWSQLKVPGRLPWYGFVWNPGNRAAKVLFDTAQQLHILAATGVPFDVAIQTDSYRLVDDVVADAAGMDVDATQFMILTHRAGAEAGSQLTPILVSQERTVSGHGVPRPR